MATHIGEKPHTCPKCGKHFTLTNSLKIHIMTHTGEKPHTCPQCDKQFIRSGRLKGTYDDSLRGKTSHMPSMW